MVPSICLKPWPEKLLSQYLYWQEVAGTWWYHRRKKVNMTSYIIKPETRNISCLFRKVLSRLWVNVRKSELILDGEVYTIMDLTMMVGCSCVVYP